MKNLKNCLTTLLICCASLPGSQNLEREYEGSFLYFWEHEHSDNSLLRAGPGQVSVIRR